MNIEQIVKSLKTTKKSFLASQPSNSFRILISTILSQRTRDENTYKATDQLFAKYNNPKAMSKARISDIQRLIKPAGFYSVKAKRIKKVSRIIINKYNGIVPDNIHELLKLPGVGRKTANCVLVYAFGKAAIPVDTHVHRISNRLGLVNTRTPEETEKSLLNIIPKRYWMNINELFVIHGRNICLPRNPKCNICPIKKYCSYFRSQNKGVAK